jgi:hypothetical protein
MTQTLLMKGVSLLFALMVAVLLMGLMNPGSARASTDYGWIYGSGLDKRRKRCGRGQRW